MKITDLLNEDGRIVKGVNTTVDVGPNEIKTQAAKFGNTVDKDGRPPTLSTKVKGKSTNVLFNLGLAEHKFTPMELACMEGGHDMRDLQQKEPGDLFKMLDEKWSKKYKRSINCNNPKGFSQKAHCAGRNKNESIEESLDRIATESLVEALGQIDPSTEIYVDMDGVLADFFGEWAKVMGKDNFRDIEDPANAIKKIKTVEDFWLNLPMLPQAKELLLLIKKVKGKYKICTSPLADDPRSEPHKRQWVKDHLDFFPPEEVLVTHNKPQFATQNDGTPNILIDDYGVNINAWEKAGGIGFKYKDHKFERTSKAIKQHMQEPVAENFADGKKKGKSRPGRVKKSGASCNGSVTALRKRAKNASGEKAKMYHWCANMKSGRKKK